MNIAKSLLLSTLLLSLTGCSSLAKLETAKPTENVNSTTPQASPESQTAEQAAAANIQTAAPDALIRDLYKVHDEDIKNNTDRILQTKNRAMLDKYFDKKLADLIWKDLTANRDEVGVIDFDLFYNAQDFDVKNLNIAPAKLANGKASVNVTFSNFNRKENLVYRLMEQNSVWKISDINYGGGQTLLKYFKEAEQAKNDSVATDDAMFEGTYQVGETICTVKPVKMAFEVRWAKGTGVEMFFYEDRANDQYIYKSEESSKGVNVFALNETFTEGEFIRADGKRFNVRKIK